MITKDPGKAGGLCLGLYLHLHTGNPGNSVSALHESRNLKQARPDSGQSVDLLHTEGACYSLTGNSPVQEYTLYEHEFQEKNRDQDREWDSYRNHTIGFVLQNYNLIPHQTILSNYPTDFESKDKVIEILDDYSDRMEAAGEDDKVITFTDSVGSMMSMVTEIVNILSYVLIAFVAISLVVSSIMIGVITCISVLERKQEIGILVRYRSLQAQYLPGV